MISMRNFFVVCLTGALICGFGTAAMADLGLIETEAVNPGTAAHDIYGVSVSLDGDYLAVGASWQYDDVNPGTVEIFLRNPDGSLTHQQTLTGFSGSEDFGVDVSLSGDTLAVGAYNSSSVYVYTRSGSTWSLEQTLTGAAGGRMGTTVALDGDNLVTGAYKTHQVMAFHREAGVWALESTITKSMNFSYGVGLSGDTAIGGSWNDGSVPGSASILRRVWDPNAAGVGFPGDANGDGTIDAGDAAVLAGSWLQTGVSWADGDFNDDDIVDDIDATIMAVNWDTTYNTTGAYVWNETATLQPSDSATQTWFGYRSDIDGDVAIVCAKEDDGLASGAGAAYIFRYDSGTETWVEQIKLAGDDTAAGDNFGSDVAILGNTAIVGAQFDDDNGSQSGSAYIFQWDGVTYDAGKEVWLQVDKITASDGAAGELFGGAVALEEDVFAVGSWAHPSQGGVTDLPGSAYYYVPAATQTAVPEPGTLVLMLAGLCVWLVRRRI